MLPHKLKNFNLFGDGNNWQGQVPSITVPELGRNMAEYRGAGMDGPVDIDMGHNKIECSWTVAGMIVDVYDTYGSPLHDAALLRFAGSYESDETGDVIPVEIVMRGRHMTLGSTEAQPGEDADMEITTTCSYYKLTVAGEDVIEIDMPGFVFKVRGTDRLAERRKALGV